MTSSIALVTSICVRARAKGPDVGKTENELLIPAYRQLNKEKNKNKIKFLSQKMNFLHIFK